MTKIALAAKCVSIFATTVALIIVASSYYYEVRHRKAAREWDISISTEDNGKYTAKYNYMSERLIYLKIYETATEELLATRTYDSGDIARLYWFKDHLTYSTYDTSMFYDGSINLPPTKMDKLLTYLP